MTAIAAVLVAGALVVAGSAVGDNGGPYEVRGYFDNAAFLVSGEQVRIAGATVGVVAAVEVSREDEIVGEDGQPDPGKAAIVMRVDDEEFQDFREDASCIIRPQSLLGEKFVECEPTQPRAAGSPPPPELEEIPEGQPGEGQLFLPLENNGKAVDLDLVNNIMREPFADRFRLIINDLGAGVAARGDELGEIVERANPALRETEKVLGILAKENKTLARLAEEGDAVLEPLAEERRSIRGFIQNANDAGAAAAERSADLSEGLRRLPPALAELEPTMVELQRFAQNATPVATDLRRAATDLTEATELFGPFTEQANTAITSLSNELEDAAPDLIDADPVLVQLRDLARITEGGAQELKALLNTLRRTGGYEFLGDFIFNTAGTFNGFDSFSHFLRAELLVTNCVDYVVTTLSGCEANWGKSGVGATTGAGLQRLLDLGRLEPPNPPEEADDEQSENADEQDQSESAPETLPTPEELPAV
ncbi:MAG: MlaD family protein, partial [Solirubrobacterales bacterium]